jgi:hypothetical protein
MHTRDHAHKNIYLAYTRVKNQPQNCLIMEESWHIFILTLIITLLEDAAVTASITNVQYDEKIRTRQKATVGILIY